MSDTEIDGASVTESELSLPESASDATGYTAPSLTSPHTARHNTNTNTNTNNDNNDSDSNNYDTKKKKTKREAEIKIGRRESESERTENDLDLHAELARVHPSNGCQGDCCHSNAADALTRWWPVRDAHGNTLLHAAVALNCPHLLRALLAACHAHSSACAANERSASNDSDCNCVGKAVLMRNRMGFTALHTGVLAGAAAALGTLREAAPDAYRRALACVDIQHCTPAALALFLRPRELALVRLVCDDDSELPPTPLLGYRYEIPPPRIEQPLSFDSAPAEGVRILVLDGSGARAAFLIGMLQRLHGALVARAQRRNHLVRADHVHLADHFDLIVGVSTGALIALALQQRMLLREIEEMFVALSQRVYGQPSLWHLLVLGTLYDTTKHRSWLKSFLGEGYLTDRMTSRGKASSRCAICLLAGVRDDPNALHMFGNYTRARSLPSDPHLVIDATRWQAARACTATMGLFAGKRVQSDGAAFVDAAFIVNNPTFQALEEARRIWKIDNRSISTLVSLGTGLELGAGENVLATVQTRVRLALDNTPESMRHTHIRDLLARQSSACNWHQHFVSVEAELAQSERYTRIDVAEPQSKDIDVADEIQIRTMIDMGHEAMFDHASTLAARIYSRNF